MRELSVEQFSQELATIARRGQTESAADALGQCRPVVLQGISSNFERAQSPAGTPWKPRKVLGDGHPLLQETGALRAAAAGNGAGHVDILEARSLTVGVDLDGGPASLKGARAHNEGYPPNLPQREFLGVPEKTVEACRDIIAETMLKKLWG